MTPDARRVLLPVAALAAGYAVYELGSPLTVDQVVGVQLGGGSQPLPLPAGAARDAAWDLAFVAGYGTFLWSGAGLTDVRPGGARVVRRALRLLAVGAVAADVIEDVLLLTATRPGLPEGEVRVLLSGVRVAAVAKFGLLAPAAAGVLLVVGAALRRWASGRRPTARGSGSPRTRRTGR